MYTLYILMRISLKRRETRREKPNARQDSNPCPQKILLTRHLLNRCATATTRCPLEKVSEVQLIFTTSGSQKKSTQVRILAGVKSFFSAEKIRPTKVN